MGIFGDEDVPLRHGFWWECIGLIACFALTLGFTWADRRALADQEPAAAPTTVFSEVATCRVQAVLGTETTSVVAHSSLCDKPGLPLPDVAPVETDRAHQIGEVLGSAPMAAMADLLAQYDQVTVSMAVGIGKVESDWGRAAPHVAAGDCYNYWGYKGVGGRGSIAGGYACFASPEEAVGTVVGRIDHLVRQDRRDTPSKMVVWKCGSSCDWDHPENVNRWIGTVNTYYQQLAKG